MRIGVLYSRVRPEEKLGHPELEIAQVTSRRLAGAFVHFTHPNLRGHTDLRYCTADELERCDLLFLCLPHGSAAGDIDVYSRLAPRIVDLSADFRLRSPSAYADWYAAPHPAPEWLDRFVYGLPELDRDAVAGASHVSGVGCNATGTIRCEQGDASLELRLRGYEVGVRADRHSPLVRAFLGAIRSVGGPGTAPKFVVKTGTCDMNIVWPVWRCPIVAYGPGDSTLDHTPNEHLELDEYLLAVDTVELSLRNLAAAPPAAS